MAKHVPERTILTRDIVAILSFSYCKLIFTNDSQSYIPSWTDYENNVPSVRILILIIISSFAPRATVGVSKISLIVHMLGSKMFMPFYIIEQHLSEQSIQMKIFY